jgi:hypothetical protein
MQVLGGCHCGNITFEYDVPAEGDAIAARVCRCSFCTMHGAEWTSHRSARLTAVVRHSDVWSRYRFATRSADFHVCGRCGGLPFATCEIDGRLYAVVNICTFAGFDRALVHRAVADFGDESGADRLARRQRTWIPAVVLAGPVQKTRSDEAQSPLP